MKTLNRTQEEYKTRINKVVHYIASHLNEEYNLDKLADISCFSRFHFHRIFTAITGETPNDFLKRVRLDVAANMLVNLNNLSIAEVAYSVGFSSQSSFARAFKERFGLSAGQWKEAKTEEVENILQKSKIWQMDSNTGKIIENEGSYFAFVNNLFIETEEGLGAMEIKIKDLPETKIAFYPVMEGYKDQPIHDAWNVLCQWAGSNGLINKESKFIGVGLDNPDITHPDKCRYYASISLQNDIKTPEKIRKMILKGGLYAVARYEGDESGIINVYRTLMGKWIPENGYIPRDEPGYEIYIQTPDNNQHDSKKHFVMDVCIPVMPMK